MKHVLQICTDISLISNTSSPLCQATHISPKHVTCYRGHFDRIRKWMSTPLISWAGAWWKPRAWASPNQHPSHSLTHAAFMLSSFSCSLLFTRWLRPNQSLRCHARAEGTHQCAAVMAGLGPPHAASIIPPVHSCSLLFMHCAPFN